MRRMKPELTIDSLCSEAAIFAETESQHREIALFGVTDGKAVGTYLEAKFKRLLAEKFRFDLGNAASGIDLPGLLVDLKVTSVTQPQSSCPFKSARQKIYGLGYSLLVFVYEKSDDPATKTSTLNIVKTVFVEDFRTADFQTTSGIQQILNNDGNKDDVLAFFNDRNLPVDDIEASRIADELLSSRKITIGYLTISNALQWRLQYSRVLIQAGNVLGLRRIR